MFSRRDANTWRRRSLGLIGAAVLAGGCLLAVAADSGRQIVLSLADVSGPGYHAAGVTLTLDGGNLDAAQVAIDSIGVAGHVWHNVRLDCPHLLLEKTAVKCNDGVLDAGVKLPVAFSYSSAARHLEVTVSPAARERWQFVDDFSQTATRAGLAVTNGQIKRLGFLLPPHLPALTAGTLNGNISFDGSRARGKITVAGAAFSDASGQHAGDKIDAVLQLDAARNRAGGWDWNATIDWPRGEVYWQPLYVAAQNYRLTAKGDTGDKGTYVTAATLDLSGIGRFAFTGNVAPGALNTASGTLHASGIQLDALAERVIRPFFAGTAFAKLSAAGQADIDVAFANGVVDSLDLDLRNASLDDGAGKYRLNGIRGSIPWRRAAPTQATLNIKSGSFSDVPMGQVKLPLRLDGFSVAASNFKIPLLDGGLSLDDFAARRAAGKWQWQFEGGVLPISMEALTKALGWPQMHGTLSGVIPQVRYDGSSVTVNGVLLFNVFDGAIVAKNLRLADAFGRVPRLSADLTMSDLDLGLLTSTFSFGSITGRIDAEVNDLELINWKPVAFDAKISSSPGNYRRRISQRAVQSISALGGAGAAAAIQRGFLGFFKEFGYSRIGLSCRLQDGVCHTGGITAQGNGYVIVQGGGIPAITVMGYNHDVNWNVLLARLERITQENVKPIVN
ncbi:MAG TPA: hypothetical protein VFK51_01690 [Burkholderiales bacterium]|nr:hypothetical protein [Burkholderiales bacterium]